MSNEVENPNSMNIKKKTEQKDDKPVLEIYQYLQQLGDRQRNLLETFYHSFEKPCGENVRCEDTFENMGFGCTFLSPKHHHYDYAAADIPHEFSDPCFNPNIVGPKCCEYCKAPTTLQCDPKTCDRPPLFFLKKKPAFETNSIKWTKDGYRASDVHSRDMDFLRKHRIPRSSAAAVDSHARKVEETKHKFIGFF